MGSEEHTREVTVLTDWILVSSTNYFGDGSRAVHQKSTPRKQRNCVRSKVFVCMWVRVMIHDVIYFNCTLSHALQYGSHSDASVARRIAGRSNINPSFDLLCLVAAIRVRLTGILNE